MRAFKPSRLVRQARVRETIVQLTNEGQRKSGIVGTERALDALEQCQLFILRGVT